MPNIKLVVEVLHATNLSPKDGEDSASPYVEVDYESQRLRTKSKSKDLNPMWNEKLEFTVSDPNLLEYEWIYLHVYTTRRHGSRVFLGRTKVDPSHIKPMGQENAIGFPLERGWSVFSINRGEIYLKVYYYDGDRSLGAKTAAAGGGAGGGSIGVAGGKNGKQGDKVGAAPSSGHAIPSNGTTGHANTTGIGGHGGLGMDAVTTAADRLLGGGKVAQTVTLSDATSFTDFSVKPTWLPKTERIRHDLVDEIKYLFVRVERARGLAIKDVTGSSDPFVEAKVGNTKVLTRVIPRDLNPVWNEVFAFSQDQFQAQNLEITVWDEDTVRNDFLGRVTFDVVEIPQRHPPDSPLAPQWYRLESRHDAKRPAQGEIMLSVWIGTQADESFPRARQSDSGWVSNTRATIYLSPRLWYLRVAILEAKDLIVTKSNRIAEVFVRVDVCRQSQKTKAVPSQKNSHLWNTELLFVAAEPFSDEFLHVHVLDHVAANKEELMATVKIPLNTVPKRMNHSRVDPKWFDLEREKKDIKEVAHEIADKVKGNAKFMSRIHLMVCLEGGYHVLDESTQYTSDTCPSERRLWKNPVAMLELGIRGAFDLQPMKTRDNRGCTDAYCVAKYGRKWVRTRTVLESLAPRWHEQYMWDVYDPCTVLTVGVFDNNHLGNGFSADKSHTHAHKHSNGGNGSVSKNGGHGGKDEVIGKVRIRLSTLETDKEYALRYPLIVLDRSGVKSRGEIELVVRLTCVKRLNMMLTYIQPLLPKQHYIEPINVRYIEYLRAAAMRLVIDKLALSEPPIPPEVVRYMLDVDQYKWSYRRSKANWYRIIHVFDGCVAIAAWFRDICMWKSKVTTVLVHILYCILVWFPELILPTTFLYMFLIGAWQYRFRSRQPPHMDVGLSYANVTGQEELDEEFDDMPSTKSAEIVRIRYDRMRALAGRVQTVVGDIANQLERFHSFLNWRDPRATSIFVTFCLLMAIILYLIPIRVVIILFGIYIMRYPRFRNRLPSIAGNFFRRLPSLSDRML
ncbi:hypothetical protein KP509_23G063100 [Ceratopteris richardii]|uniref:C2 domain-containing protein n=1 Tax=Ceratopteris richardii TaxID=49495 RepID=A0A8T2S0I2_CERRI|nr:hypothetical protein KP509_23G063100 [Ceratopteris richardii]